MRGLGRGFGAGGPGGPGFFSLASCDLGSAEALRAILGEELLGLSDRFSVTGGGTCPKQKLMQVNNFDLT